MWKLWPPLLKFLATPLYISMEEWNMEKLLVWNACFVSGTTKRQKFRGRGGVYPRKFFPNGFARTGKTAQNESVGGNLSLLPPWRRH